MATKKKYYCHKCGTELTNSNCRKANNSISGFSHLCIDCEEARLQEIAELQGIYEGLFSQCAALDVPLVPRVLDGVDLTTLDKPWRAYLRLLKDNGEYLVDGQLRGFKDGVKSIFGVFGNNLTHTDFTARIKQDVAKIQAERKRKQAEEERIAKLPGTKEQRERWGQGILYKPQMASVPMLSMTQETYDDLDRVFETRASSFKGQDLTPQQLSVLVRVCKKEVIADHLTKYGATKFSTEIEKSISSLLADENMRPKDKKPVEELRLDALVLALEEAGLMENGDLLNYDELIEVLRDEFVKSKKYDYSLDVVDQSLLFMQNAMRFNADLPPLQDLPEEFAPVDEYGEFEPEETEREKENKRFLGITKVSVVKSDKGDNE